jgi:ATP-dependent exoDNAse (exonuclease V) beta subunit
MPLHLITGLPNTGRTEDLKSEFLEAAGAGRNPILLVPSVDDVFAWERRLTRSPEAEGTGRSAIEQGAGGFAGGRIFHFQDMCREVVRSADGKEPRVAGEMRRRLALERAVEAAAKTAEGPAARIQGRTDTQPGLLDAALELVDEYRAERIERGDPYDADRDRANEGPSADALETIRAGIEPLVTEYELDLEADGLTDIPRLADRALEVVADRFKTDPAWKDRPVFVAGFDDMTGQQLELLRKLTNEAEVEVWMVVTRKDDLGRGFLTDRLMSRLVHRVGITDAPAGFADSVADRPSPSSPLAGLAEAFITDGRDRKLESNPPVTLIRAAGERKEAEAIGAEIARLLAAGDTLPDEIAIAHTDPSSSGRLLLGVLRRYEIPATLETETGALSTSVGASLAALLRAAGPDGTADDLILWLRGPLGPDREAVDELERDCRRRGIGSARGAFELVTDRDRGPWMSLFEDEDRNGPDVLVTIGDLARQTGRKILKDAAASTQGAERDSVAIGPDPVIELEVRMAETLAEAAADLASADTGGKAGTALMLDAIRRGEIKVWTVPTKGSVRITGLWALRAKRVRYLFVAGLQEGGTRDLSRAGPFLSTSERRGLEMLERVDPEVQARYLLFSCLNVPTDAIWLCCTTSDDSGKSTAPSPLIAEIVGLCPDPLPLLQRSGSDVSFPPILAPTETELLRSLVVESGSPDALGVGPDLTARLNEGIRRTAELDKRSRELGKFENPDTKATIAGIESFSPSEIEAWLACPWSWLLDRRINPKPFRPDPTYLISGTFVHAVLERLYRQTPGAGPTPEDLEDWLDRIPALFEEVLSEDPDSSLVGDEPAIRLARFTLDKMIRDFIRREAEQASPEFVPALFEQRFLRVDSDREPVPRTLDEVEMDGWRLRGMVDRVDIRGGGEPVEGAEALVMDYKTGSADSDHSASKLVEKGKVQVPLYMLALQRSLGLKPVAGFILPLKESDDNRPRGAIPKDEPEVVGGRGHVSTDLVDSVESFMDAAHGLANQAVSGIREGSLEHPPDDCRKHLEDPDHLLPATPSVPPPEVVTEAAPELEESVLGSEEGESFPFSQEQEEVIDSRAKEIMVAAAAGSGKTSVTVERYRRLLEGGAKEKGLEPDQILVFTFTDKAAAKLREEVRSARARDAGEAVGMSDAWVGTFHSICSRILTAYPLEAGVDPNFAVIDDITASTLRDEAFDRALRSSLEKGSAEEIEERLEVLAQVKQSTLKKGILSTFDLLRSRGCEFPALELEMDVPTYPGAKLKDLSKRIDKALDRDDISRFKDGDRFDQKGKCRNLKSLIDGRGDEPVRAAEIKAFSFNNAALEEAVGIPSLREEIERDLNECEGYPWLTEFDNLLKAFGQEYSKLKESRSALDYEDLQVKTLNLLEGNPEIRNEYGARFKEIMVDEFQDTNQLQMRLIEALRPGKTSRLMTVGDEMQAIYGFRHADVGIFRDRMVDLVSTARGCDVIELPMNYRSDPAVIEAVNTIGSRIHRSNGDDEGTAKGNRDPSPSFSELVAGREAGHEGPATTLLLTPEKGWAGVDLGPLCPAESGHSEGERAATAEALAVASRLRDIVDSGRYSQKDIAILLRATTKIDYFQNALTRFGLRSVVPSSKGFWSSEAVLELLSLISVVANPLDDRALVAALTSPACGVGPDGLWMVRETAGRNEALWHGVEKLALGWRESGMSDEDPSGDLAAIVGFHKDIETARSRLDRTPLESLVSGLLDETGLDLASLARDRASLAALERVATLAGEYERQEGRDLRGFLDWASSSREADAEAAIAASSEHDDAIKIMTIHKAKGLEFPVVCVPDLGRPLGRGLEGPVVLDFEGQGGAMRVGLQIPNSGQKVFEWPDVEKRADRETEAEELRLIHVAMTRAEERLILSGRFGPAGDGNRFRLPAINRIVAPFHLDLEDPESWVSSISGSSGAKALEVEANLPEDEENLEQLTRTFPLVLKTRNIEGASPPLERPERAFFPDVPLSFSGMVEFRECPARFFARRVLRMEVESSGTPWAGPDSTALTERDGGTKFGTAVHDLFEGLALKRWVAPSKEEIEAALTAVRLDPSADDRAKKASEMIEAFLSSDLGKMASDGSAVTIPEVPIVLGIGGLTIRGFIDLLVKTGDGTWVIDYKTNSLTDASPDELMAKTYELQRDLYSLAIARAGKLETVESAFIFLEEPDSPVLKTYGPADLEAVEERLRSEVVEPITKARYFGGGAGPQPCGGCDSCRLLGLADD